VKLFWFCAGILGVTLLPLPAKPAGPATPETVVLLHGLGRTGGSMWWIARSLRREGYRVIAPSYPWRTQSLEALARTWLPAQLATEAGASRIHFVTHSMGGILLRAWLRECGAPANLGRSVMLAPPNAGSEIPDHLAGYAWFRWLVGGNAPRLGTAPDSLPRSLGPWPADAGALGIIAGDRPFPGPAGDWLPAPHDGKVSVASTHLAGERAHAVLPYSHTWLGWHTATVTLVTRFLREGRFEAD
jgi:pimeloyl-ACP methyl ester carboxylesterase